MKYVKILVLALTLPTALLAQRVQTSTNTDYVDDHVRFLMAETDDCVPIALANITETPYPEMVQLCEDYFGRCKAEGVLVADILRYLEPLLAEVGFKPTGIWFSGAEQATVEYFAEISTDQRMLLLIPEHAIGVRDFVVYDHSSRNLDARVKIAILIEQI